MKLHRYVDHQRLHIVTKDVISLSISVLLLFRHYISHKITFGAPSSGGVLRSACGAFIIIANNADPDEMQQTTKLPFLQRIYSPLSNKFNRVMPLGLKPQGLRALILCLKHHLANLYQVCYPHAFLKKRRGYCYRLRPSVMLSPP